MSPYYVIGTTLWGAGGRPGDHASALWWEPHYEPGGEGVSRQLGASWGLTGTTPVREESPGKGVAVGTGTSSDHSRSPPPLPLAPSSSHCQGPGEGIRGGSSV